MRKTLIGVAALAAVAIPTTGFAVFTDNEGEELLESIAIDRLALDAFAGDLCDAARDMTYAFDDDEVVDMSLDIFVDSYGPHDPAVYVYVAGLITGCLS